MIELTLKISDKENGTPGEVCEEIMKAIQSIDEMEDGSTSRFHVVEAKAKKVK